MSIYINEDFRNGYEPQYSQNADNKENHENRTHRRGYFNAGEIQETDQEHDDSHVTKPFDDPDRESFLAPFEGIEKRGETKCLAQLEWQEDTRKGCQCVGREQWEYLLPPIQAKQRKAKHAKNMEDKKARIDENISIALMFNVLEASLYLNDFEKVDDYISRLGKIKLNYSEKENLKSITTRKEDREKRMLANK